MSPLAGSATACVMFNTKSALGILQLSAQRRDGVHPLCLRPAILLRPALPARRSLPTSAVDHSKNVLHANQRTTAAWMFPALYGGSRRQTAGSLRRFRMTSGRYPRRGGNFGSAARGSADIAIKGRYFLFGSVLSERSAQPKQKR